MFQTTNHNILGNIIPELIINQQGFWTLLYFQMDVILWKIHSDHENNPSLVKTNPSTMVNG